MLLTTLRRRIRGKTSAPNTRPQVPVVGVDARSDEDATARRRVYLITLPHPRSEYSSDGVRLRAPSEFTREQMLAAFLDACAHPEYRDQHSREQGYSVDVDLAGVFVEFHKADENGEAHPHGHIPCSAGSQFRFLPVKRSLLSRHGLASHWSCTHDGYWSAVRYCSWPSAKKPLASLDMTPCLWAVQGVHPPLHECCHEPMTAKALLAKRLHKEKKAAEQAKPEPRVTELDVYALVVDKSFRNTPDDRTAADQLFTHAKVSCSRAMWEFLWKNRARLPGLIDDVWRSESMPEELPRKRMTRMDALHAAAASPCTCRGCWASTVVGAMMANSIPIRDLCKDILNLLERGRSPDTPVVVLAGALGGECKSMFLKPLKNVFAEGQVFNRPVKGNFPLLDLLDSKVCFFDEWRFDEDVLPWSLQQLLYDGSDVPVNRPQNVQGQTGHTTYKGSSPVFVTTKLSDMQSLRWSASLNPRTGQPWNSDASMMLRRLKVYEYHTRIPKPVERIPFCARCFSELVLNQGS